MEESYLTVSGRRWRAKGTDGVGGGEEIGVSFIEVLSRVDQRLNGD